VERTENHLLARLAAARTGGLKKHERDLLARVWPDKSAWTRAGKDAVERLLGRDFRGVWEPASSWTRAETDALLQRRLGLWTWFWDEKDFPAALGAIPDPPYLLWGRGERPPLDRCWAAVVGTRSPSEEGKTAAWKLGVELGRLGVVVVSGLARGIDASAHRGAVESGGLTVAVLGQGIDWVFPAGNRNLARQIVANGGTLLSEYGPGTPALAWHFPARNRLVSGLCRTVVVVEAPKGSGALITADLGLDQGRDVVVHRVGLETVRGDGTRSLAEQGACVIGSAKDLVRMWNEGSVGLADLQQKLPWEGP
jgi:DNA processing protein